MVTQSPILDRGVAGDVCVISFPEMQVRHVPLEPLARNIRRIPCLLNITGHLVRGVSLSTWTLWNCEDLKDFRYW